MTFLLIITTPPSQKVKRTHSSKQTNMSAQVQTESGLRPTMSPTIASQPEVRLIRKGVTSGKHGFQVHLKSDPMKMLSANTQVMNTIHKTTINYKKLTYNQKKTKN